MKKMIVLALSILVSLVGMSSAVAAPKSDCIVGSRPVIRFDVVSDTQVEVVQSSRNRFVVEVESCPSLSNAASVGFANGPDQVINYRGQSVFATPTDGALRVCGRAGDRLVVRQSGAAVGGLPSTGCNIVAVKRIVD